MVPSPRRPFEESKMNPEPPALPKRMVEDAETPLVKSIKVEVAFATEPKEVVVVNGNAKLA